MSVPHLVVAISAHGYGHLSQVAPIINHLREQPGQLRLTLRSDLSAEVLRHRIHGEFAHQAVADDFGMVMLDAARVDREASLAAYLDMHGHWQQRVDACARQLESIAADLVLADVPYLTLAAARQAGIPSVALCSLNWFDIAREYLPDNARTQQILDTMADAYQSAQVFMQPEPCMTMGWLDNRRSIGPLGSPGSAQREVMQQVAHISREEKVMLVAMGGMPLQLDIKTWQPPPGVRLLIPPDWPVDQPRVHHYSDFGLNFQDVLASSDLVITKSGYGTIVEAAAAGVPVLHLRRPDWAETPYLESWLDDKVHQRSVDTEQFSVESASAACDELLALGKKPATAMTGVQQAVATISSLLSTR